ncbi:Pv-fam-g protein [Plasmodium ovale wallikeri]|uniref:Pv-fam-g protein n=1 Tax=Plasmodium ovale wallikeri TaxID=864142 RepID=A0A1A8ZFS2_PLAOA|nr:Pv-fam-g protein [Plasmodium ovale wallikeri]
MDMTKCRSSIRKHKISNAEPTYEKPTVRGSMLNETCSDEGEIEFEGWVEFVTKNDNDSDNDNDNRNGNKNEYKNGNKNEYKNGNKNEYKNEYKNECKNEYNNGYNNECNNDYNDNCEGDAYGEKGKKRNTKRYSTFNIPWTTEENTYLNNIKRVDRNSRRESSKNNVIRNEQNPEYLYTSSNYQYEQPIMMTTNGGEMVYASENRIYPVITNTQERENNAMNVLSPNYVDPIPPVVLKNQQILPQLYIRQPPTVIVTNEPRPPLVINPPPANIVFKNKAPQPIYVNSTRPNIIIKNDPAIIQNPVDMDTTPIQLDMPSPSCTSPIKESIKYSTPVTFKKESVVDNRNCFFKTNINTLQSSTPSAHVIQVDNNISDISQQTIPNVYMINDSNHQLAHLYQTHIPLSTINPINNVIHAQQPLNQGINYIVPDLHQTGHPTYALALSQPDTSGGHTMHQQMAYPATQPVQQAAYQMMTSPSVQAVPSQSVQAMPSQSVQAVSSQSVQAMPSQSVQAMPSQSVQAMPSQSVQAMPSQSVQAMPSQSVQAMPSQSVQAMPSPSVQMIPPTQQYEVYGSMNNQLPYENGYTTQTAQPIFANGNSPSYIYPNSMPRNTMMHAQTAHNTLPRTRTILPNNNMIESSPNLMRYHNPLPHNIGVNKSIMQQPAASSEHIPSCGLVGCASPNKGTHTHALRRNTYSNTYANMMQPLPKKVQIVARPVYNESTRSYNVYR